MRDVAAVLRADQIDRAGRRLTASVGGASIPVEGLAEELGVGISEAFETVMVTRTPTGPRAIAVDRFIGRTRVASDALITLPGGIGRHARRRFDALISDPAFTGLACSESRGHATAVRHDAATGHRSAERRTRSRPVHAAGRLVTFSVSVDPASPRVGIAAAQMAELRGAAGVVHVPGTLPYVGGVVAWRGHAVPVVRVGAALNWLRGAPREERRVIARVALQSGFELVALYAGRDVQFEDDIVQFQPSPVGEAERAVVDLAFENGARRVVTLRFDQLL
jgi:chemotaxis signal transduction protein